MVLYSLAHFLSSLILRLDAVFFFRFFFFLVSESVELESDEDELRDSSDSVSSSIVVGTVTGGGVGRVFGRVDT
jgi:hypothetical protein